VVIEFQNTHPSRKHSSLGGVAFAASAAIFLFIPVSLILLGYYTSQPTGTLLSPLPQTVISEETTPPTEDTPSYEPIIAADNPSTPSAIDATLETNSTDHTAVIPPGVTEIKIEDSQINSDSQILIIPQNNDSSIYFVKSKGDGFFTLSVDNASTENRNIDYQVVTP